MRALDASSWGSCVRGSGGGIVRWAAAMWCYSQLLWPVDGPVGAPLAALFGEQAQLAQATSRLRGLN
ncbi:hypothetical protein GGTG_03042 [Gaeumannomyces tritici R3-111a-1]|uniref:Uncharacterized protein n=1 Tax=Gaeumannomyces tritici (strain R3-111a-1) TaxID=644352 RepID=J3NP36_GAET3|nr:hypothetical protein GGTG_03042 [Gaeumannomyces tritici R3-111a-1]EJT77939.1 hypothetical protein GGTG_03042 [Gaeumannomyces tritici R3-111a-1]